MQPSEYILPESVMLFPVVVPDTSDRRPHPLVAVASTVRETICPTLAVTGPVIVAIPIAGDQDVHVVSISTGLQVRGGSGS